MSTVAATRRWLDTRHSQSPNALPPLVDRFRNTTGVPCNSSPRSRGDRGGGVERQLAFHRTEIRAGKRKMLVASADAFHHPPSFPPRTGGGEARRCRMPNPGVICETDHLVVRFRSSFGHLKESLQRRVSPPLRKGGQGGSGEQQLHSPPNTISPNPPPHHGPVLPPDVVLNHPAIPPQPRFSLNSPTLPH